MEYICEKCNRSFYHESSFEGHKSMKKDCVEILKKRKLVPCEHCDVICSNEQYLDIHHRNFCPVKSKEYEEEEKERDPRYVDVDKIDIADLEIEEELQDIDCDYCKKHYHMREKLFEHEEDDCFIKQMMDTLFHIYTKLDKMENSEREMVDEMFNLIMENNYLTKHLKDCRRRNKELEEALKDKCNVAGIPISKETTHTNNINIILVTEEGRIDEKAMYYLKECLDNLPEMMIHKHPHQKTMTYEPKPPPEDFGEDDLMTPDEPIVEEPEPKPKKKRRKVKVKKTS